MNYHRVVGISLMLFYMIRFKIGFFGLMDPLPPEKWWFGTSPEGFGTLAMCINIFVSLIISRLTPPPLLDVQEIVENIRIPDGAGKATNH